MKSKKRRGYGVSVTNIRRVWMTITKTPQATSREIEKKIDLSYSCVNVALRALRDLGYINYAPRSGRSRTILVPFGEIRQNDAAASL